MKNIEDKGYLIILSDYDDDCYNYSIKRARN